MKEIIAVMDQDPTYSKKFCNQAIKLFGKKYLFLSFQNINRLKEYTKENKIEALIVSDEISEYVDDVKVNELYILNEKNKKSRKEGKRTHVYKLQNINSILEIIDSDIEKKSEKKVSKDIRDTKVILFYTPIYIKNKMEILKKIAKIMSKRKSTIIFDINEFTNYKGNVGLSNIIYNYKENALDKDNIKREIVSEKEQDFIQSVTYPDDFQVINSIDLANIVNEIKNLDYDFIFVNADQSFVKCQYVANDADMLILIADKEKECLDIFKKYARSENQIDCKKIIEFDSTKIDKAYLTAFVKENIDV